MHFQLTPRSMTLDDLELYKFEFSENFSGFRRFRTQQHWTAKWMKIDRYCQRQRCKHVELEQFLACFCLAWVCQRQLGFLVVMENPTAGSGLSLDCVTAWLASSSAILFPTVCLCAVTHSSRIPNDNCCRAVTVSDTSFDTCGDWFQSNLAVWTNGYCPVNDVT